MRPESPPAAPLWLGRAGLLPFITAALLLWLGRWSDLAATAFIAYGAVILAFLGGIRWGLAQRLPAAEQLGPLLYAVTPSLLAFAALLLPSFGAALALLAAGFIAALMIDLCYPPEGAPVWYPRLRLELSLAALLLHLAVWLRLSA